MRFQNVPIHLVCGTLEDSDGYNISDVWFDAEKGWLWATDRRMVLAVQVWDVQSFETSGAIPAKVFRRLISDVPLGMEVEMLAVPGRIDFPGISKIGTMKRVQSDDRPRPPFEEFIPPAKREEVVLGLNARLLYRLARAMSSDVIEIAFTPGAVALGNVPEATVRILPTYGLGTLGEVLGILMPTKQSVVWGSWEGLAREGTAEKGECSEMKGNLQEDVLRKTYFERPAPEDEPPSERP